MPNHYRPRAKSFVPSSPGWSIWISRKHIGAPQREDLAGWVFQEEWCVPTDGDPDREFEDGFATGSTGIRAGWVEEGEGGAVVTADDRLLAGETEVHVIGPTGVFTEEQAAAWHQRNLEYWAQARIKAKDVEA